MDEQHSGAGCSKVVLFNSGRASREDASSPLRVINSGGTAEDYFAPECLPCAQHFGAYFLRDAKSGG